jgi:hypothetical protein
MAEEHKSIDNRSTSPLPFEEFVGRRVELAFVRLDSIELRLRTGIAERFLQLSRQIKHLDQKVDVSIH